LALDITEVRFSGSERRLVCSRADVSVHVVVDLISSLLQQTQIGCRRRSEQLEVDTDWLVLDLLVESIEESDMGDSLLKVIGTRDRNGRRMGNRRVHVSPSQLDVLRLRSN
ncbi:hypothetical protein PMAYCL1PPCAC_28660, partial [Pristionchus mayeri]